MSSNVQQDRVTSRNGAQRMRELMYRLHVDAGVSDETLLIAGLAAQAHCRVSAYCVGETVGKVLAYRPRADFAERFGGDPEQVGYGPLGELANIIEKAACMTREEAADLAARVWWHEVRVPAVLAELAQCKRVRGGAYAIYERHGNELDEWMEAACTNLAVR